MSVLILFLFFWPCPLIFLHFQGLKTLSQHINKCFAWILYFRRTWRTWRPGKRNRNSRRLRKSFLRGSSSSSTEKYPESRWLLSSGEWELLQWNSWGVLNRGGKPRQLKSQTCFRLLLLPYRCFGGEVSWDKSVCIGSAYEVTDETITHQIVDRPNIEKQFLNRYRNVVPFFLFSTLFLL